MVKYQKIILKKEVNWQSFLQENILKQKILANVLLLKITDKYISILLIIFTYFTFPVIYNYIIF